MPDRQPLRIGCVKYLNARPLVFGGPADVVLDHPSVLCAQLADGELDVALVSSFEFLRNPIYRIVDGISISSDGPVYSVVVAHVGEISAAEQIELDPAAETSGNLLRCLLSELKLRPRFVATSTSSLAKERARLLIGDQAIRFRQQNSMETNSSFGTSAKIGKNLPAFHLSMRSGSFDRKLSIQNQLRIGCARCAIKILRTSKI